jgi:signal transduction histidine kinase
VAIDNASLYEQAQKAAALEERQRLARELHDSVAQALYGISLNTISASEILVEKPAEARMLLQRVQMLAKAGLGETRSVIRELRPELLERDGLVAALLELAAAMPASGIDVTTDLGEEPQIGVEQKVALYRIAQEALHNIAKHAGVKRATMKLYSLAGEVVLEASDSGAGFDPAQPVAAGHLGLQSMRERADRVRGVLEIDSQCGEGTCIRARIPTAS